MADEAVEALTKLEAKPNSEGRKATVVEELTSSKILNDPDLEHGVTVYAEVNVDYRIRPEPSDMFPVLDRRRARHPA
jgi:hypothetical protein